MIKRIYVIAGEASADLHASSLMYEMNKLQPGIHWRGWGGSQMMRNGLTVDVRYEEANYMGFIEVIKNLPHILGLFRKTKNTILEFKPDFLLLLDYPGFNLRMAKWAQDKGIRVCYYIAPQVWAWKENRVNIIRQCVKKLYVILPFEEAYFKNHGVSTAFYGHPLPERISLYQSDPHFRRINNLTSQSIIAVLPGSRAQEIKKMLPVYLQVLSKECRHQIVIAGLRQHERLYDEIRSSIGMKTTVVYNSTYDLLANARVALVTSGTATLETALFGVPQVVCYKGNALSYWIARQLVKVPYISLVNLILNKPAVTECIQANASQDIIRPILYELMRPEKRNEIKSSYRELQQKLNSLGCSAKIAEDILHTFT
ncbi:MAG: lipid-A-disaccharide synthase [Saprospiraceae bacterium]